MTKLYRGTAPDVLVSSPSTSGRRANGGGALACAMLALLVVALAAGRASATAPCLEGNPCSDGNACTQSDICQSSVCVGMNPKICTQSDQCHEAGSCDAQTGNCSNPPKTDGSSCSDGDACTQSDTCQSGTCSSASPKVCTQSDQCHDTGSCDAQTGNCSNPPKTDGSSCSDGNACTPVDACQNGVCQGPQMVCDDGDLCTRDFCDPDAGCVSAERPLPLASCLVALKNVIVVDNSGAAAAHRLVWKWTAGEAFGQASLGTPRVNTNYVLCIYDTAAMVPSLAASTPIAPSSALWTNKAPDGLGYDDPAGTSGGVNKTSIHTGAAGKTTVKLVAAGARLTLPGPAGGAYFDQDPSVVVQLVNSEGFCWTSQFVAGNTKRNTASLFKAVAK